MTNNDRRDQCCLKAKSLDPGVRRDDGGSKSQRF
jgi:hypothetical protein